MGKWIVPGQDPGGCIITILLGIAGAITGKFVAGLLGYHVAAGKSFSIPSIGISVLGVVILLFIYRFIRGAKKS